MSSWNTVSQAPLPEVVPAPAWALRPLTMGEVLDRTFSVYRRHFLLIAGIALVSGAVQLVTQLLQLLATHEVRVHHITGSRATLTTVGVTLLGSLAFFLAASITQAATVFALSELYLGRDTTVKASLRAIAPQWWAYPLIGIWQSLSCAWLPALLVVPAILLLTLIPGQFAMIGGLLVILAVLTMIPAFILFLRNALGVPVQVIERPGVRQSMKRSKILTRGAKATLFVLYLIVGGLYFTTAGVLGIFMYFGKSLPLYLLQSGTSLITLVIHVILIPIGLTGTAIVYFNQRVVQEGFDLLFMLGPDVQTPDVAPLAAAEPIPSEAPTYDPPVQSEAFEDQPLPEMPPHADSL